MSDRKALNVPYGGNYLHEGSTYEVISPDNPLGLPVGTIIEEVCRGSAWDDYAKTGDSWIFFRLYSAGSPLERGFLGNIPPERRSHPVLTNSTTWFRTVEFKPG
jgi:hypothetical protein